MLQVSIIEESTSIWFRPIIVLFKPHGLIRMGNYFQASAPNVRLPGNRVDKLVEYLRRPYFISTLDLTKGY